MSCGSCNTKSGSPKGCKNNGVCGTDGCNKLNVFDWLTNLDLLVIVLRIFLKSGSKMEEKIIIQIMKSIH